ncbi:hypothetical protein LTS18_002631, partial [Coniosporium uncinatum]
AAAMRPPSSWSSRPPVQKSIGARIRDLPAELQVEILSWFDCHILRQLEEHTFKPLSVIKGSENHFQQKVLRSRFATEVSFLYKDLTHYTTVYPGLFSTVVRPVDCLVELQMWQDTTYAVLDRAIEVFHLDESVEAYRKYYRVLTSLYLFKHSPINGECEEQEIWNYLSTLRKEDRKYILNFIRLLAAQLLQHYPIQYPPEMSAEQVQDFQAKEMPLRLAERLAFELLMISLSRISQSMYTDLLVSKSKGDAFLSKSEEYAGEIANSLRERLWHDPSLETYCLGFQFLRFGDNTYRVIFAEDPAPAQRQFHVYQAWRCGNSFNAFKKAIRMPRGKPLVWSEWLSG